MSESAKENRKTITDAEYRRRSEVANNTRKKNGTYATSKYEQVVYEALQCKYKKQDILCQYSDERYPYKCDFYIKSEDLFIEINIHPSHFEHLYNPMCNRDSEILNELEQKGDKWSKMVIYTWSVLDRKKHDIAVINNLNYLTVYPSTFETFIEDLRSYNNEIQ